MSNRKGGSDRPTAVSKRSIGVLGGMGPEATVLMMSRIIDQTPATSDQEHIPMLIDCNPQVPSRVDAIIDGRGEDPGPPLQAMARRLERNGATALAMPCNTAHYYAADIQAAVRIPLLNMVELTVRRLASDLETGARVGFLASPAVKSIGLYEKALAPYGIELVYPLDQQGILQAILALKAGTRSDANIEFLGAAVQELVHGGSEIIVIACTEISTVADKIAGDVTLVDALDILVQSVIAFALQPDVEVSPPAMSRRHRARILWT